MANIKITDLTAYTDPATTDVVPIVDVGNDTTKKVSVGEVVGKISGDVDVATDGTSSIAAGVIVDADVNASAEIAVSKLADGAARQLLQTDSAGTGVEWTDNVDIPGTLDVTGATTLDSTLDVTGLISADGKVSFPLGTAAAPSLYPGSDTGTGIYSPGANELAISTNGTGRLFVDSSGKVGIGVASPQRFLDVKSSANADYVAQFTDGLATQPAKIYVDSNGIGFVRNDFGNGIEFASSTARLHVNGSERLRITSDGKLGLGTSSPQRLLHVHESTAGENGYIQLTNATTGSGSTNGFQILVSQSGKDAVLIQREDANLEFWTNNTFQMRLDKTGKLGIGTTAPSFDLMIDKDSNSIVTSYTRSFNTGSSAGGRVSAASAVGKIAISAYSAANSVWPSSTVLGSDSGFTGGLNIYQEGANPIVLWTNGFERARIDSSGRLLVGTSSRSDTAKLVVQGNVGGGGSAGGILALSSPYGASIGGAGAYAGQINFTDSLGGVFGNISCQADGVNATNDYPGRLVFSTNPGSPATGPTERMRIDNAGDVLINTISAGAGAGFSTKLAVNGSDTLLAKTTGVAATSAVPARFWHDAASGNNIFVSLATDATYTNRAFIDYNRSAGQVRYNVTSDRRLKSNIQDSESALNVLNQIKVRSYIWTETGYSIPHGFIAQELNEAVPDAVRAGDDGDEVVDIWSVDNAKLVPLLTKALQEAMTEIESLKARVTALEP